MARRVFFHIGAPKTGTTFLQRVLWNNRDRLIDQGILFAGDRWADRIYASDVIRGRNPIHEYAAGAWERMKNQVIAFEGDALISHELLSTAARDRAAMAIAGVAPAEVHVVFVARDYVSQLPSLWQEEVKFRRSIPLEEYDPGPLDSKPSRHFSWRALDPVDALSRWGSGVPADRIHVITLPSGGDELWKRFASVCGITADAINTSSGFVNHSLGVVEAELLRRTVPRLRPEMGEVGQEARWVRDFLAHELLVPRGGDRPVVGPERALELRQRTIETADGLRRSGYDIVGNLDELLPAGVAPVGRMPASVTDSELLDAALDTIATMLSAQRDVTISRNEWRARARASVNRAQTLRQHLQRARFRANRTSADSSRTAPSAGSTRLRLFASRWASRVLGGG